MTRTEYLQQIADELRTDYQYQFTIEYRRGSGWWAVADEMRYWYDEGEYLGRDWKEAEDTLNSLLG